jgi:iron complex outermembrane recepter protein
MKKSFYLSLLVLLSSFAAFAQSGQVSGKVEDGGAKALAAATVSLLTAKDSSVQKISAADKEGAYHFENVPDGRYLLSVTAVGYQVGYSEAFEISPATATVSVKTIQMQVATG